MGLIELPDFEDLSASIDKIGQLAKEKETLELDIALGEARVYKTCMSDSTYFSGGKQPSVAYIKAAYETTGLEDELTPLRRRLIEVETSLEVTRRAYDLMRIRIDVWRSQQATERVLS
jgi:hypothetical protein